MRICFLMSQIFLNQALGSEIKLELIPKSQEIFFILIPSELNNLSWFLAMWVV